MEGTAMSVTLSLVLLIETRSVAVISEYRTHVHDRSTPQSSVVAGAN
jgi:hypothetical protein